MRDRTSIKCFDDGLKGEMEECIASSAILEGQESHLYSQQLQEVGHEY